MRKWQEVQKLPRKEHLIKSFLSIKKAHSYSYEWAFYSIIIPIETSSQPTSTLSVGFKNRIWKQYFLLEGDNTKNFKLQHHSVRQKRVFPMPLSTT